VDEFRASSTRCLAAVALCTSNASRAAAICLDSAALTQPAVRSEEFPYCIKAAGSADGRAASGRACGLRPVPPSAAHDEDARQAGGIDRPRPRVQPTRLAQATGDLAKRFATNCWGADETPSMNATSFECIRPRELMLCAQRRWSEDACI
jgi:hypothetical protein